MSALPSYTPRPIYTLDELLGGPYPDTERGAGNSDVLADLLMHLCLQRPDLDLNGVRWFFAEATGPAWHRIVGTRYPFDTLRVCTAVASLIMSRRRLLGPRVDVAGAVGLARC